MDENQYVMLRRHTYDVFDRNDVNVAIGDVRIVDGKYWIFNILTDPQSRGEGLATAILQQIVADHDGQHCLYVQVTPEKGQPLNTQQLVQWYKKFGFRETEVPHILVREGV